MHTFPAGIALGIAISALYARNARRRRFAFNPKRPRPTKVDVLSWACAAVRRAQFEFDIERALSADDDDRFRSIEAIAKHNRSAEAALGEAIRANRDAVESGIPRALEAALSVGPLRRYSQFHDGPKKTGHLSRRVRHAAEAKAATIDCGFVQARHGAARAAAAAEKELRRLQGQFSRDEDRFQVCLIREILLVWVALTGALPHTKSRNDDSLSPFGTLLVAVLRYADPKFGSNRPPRDTVRMLAKQLQDSRGRPDYLIWPVRKRGYLRTRAFAYDTCGRDLHERPSLGR
jgi:hypothetical protein